MGHCTILKMFFFSSLNSFGWISTNFTAEGMNEFSQATLLYHVFQKRDSYVNLCKFGAVERDAFFRFIPK